MNMTQFKAMQMIMSVVNCKGNEKYQLGLKPEQLPSEKLIKDVADVVVKENWSGSDLQQPSTLDPLATWGTYPAPEAPLAPSVGVKISKLPTRNEPSPSDLYEQRMRATGGKPDDDDDDEYPVQKFEDW
jgi:hypothetical protein